MNGLRGKRVLIVHNSSKTFVTQRIPVALGALKAGCEVHVATPDDGCGEKIRSLGFKFHPIVLSRRGLGVLSEWRSLRELARLYRGVKPDLVQHVTIKPVIYGGWIARLLGVPAVVSIVTGLGYVFVTRRLAGRLLRALVRIFYREALRHPNAKVIFQNPDDRAMFLDGDLVREAQCVLVKGSGVDMLRFKARPESDGAPLVVLASRMLWDKGVGEFVEAARILKSEGSGARFVLAGGVDEGNPAAIPPGRLEAWQTEGVVEWWGRRDDMPEVYAAAHLVCLPSYREGVPLALIEAAACGRALVATDVPGCREVVHHGVNGLLVPPRDARALAQALRQLLRDADMRREMGRRGRELVEAEYASEKVVAATLAVYADLIAAAEENEK